MGMPDMPDIEPAPEAPETVKRTDEETQNVRDTARAEAIRRFGAAGTNVTNGELESASVKKKTLGG